MFKVIIFSIFLSCFGWAKTVELTGFGLGIMIGDPTAFSFKGHLGNNHYFDAALAYNTGSADGLYAHGDYIIEKPGFFEIKQEEFNLYYGIGGRLYVADEKNHKDEVHLGPRVPVGVNYYLQDPSVEFFGELSVTMEITPETDADFDFSLGARYWF